MTNTRGVEFEKRVFESLNRLAELGLAKDIICQDHVVDRDRNIRKIDYTFVLRTNLADLLITIECKSKKRPLSLDDVDQIKIFKQELPERNLFWLVSEGSINTSASLALKSNGIKVYTIEELEDIVESLVLHFKIIGKSEKGISSNFLPMDIFFLD